MKVRVKTWEEMLENDKVEERYGHLVYKGDDVSYFFCPSMKYLCGKVIELVYGEYDDTKHEEGWIFEGWIFEHWMYEQVFSEEEANPKRNRRGRKLGKLEELGLERIGLQTFVIPEEFFYTTNNSLPIPEIVIDFSAIDENKFIEYMCKRIFSEGIKLGKKEVSQQLNTILSYANEED